MPRRTVDTPCCRAAWLIDRLAGPAYNRAIPVSTQERPLSKQPLTSNRLEFEEATEAIEYYFTQGWTDGLPVIPPTVERVREFLDYAGRAPSEIVGEEPTKGRVITAEKAAINAVMAGCLPEYFCVVLAAVDAISDPAYNLHAISVSTMGAATLTVVNGPVAVELGINSGVGIFGSGNRANATIGRAIRLIITNVTGAVAGDLDKGTLAHAGRYTWCVAEAEDVSPWDPLQVERGFRADQSTVTVFAGISPIQAGVSVGDDPRSIAASFRQGLLASGSGQDELVVVVSPEALGHIEEAQWSKQRFRELLHEEAPEVVKGPDGFTVIVAGGEAGGNCAIIPLWGGGSNSQSVTREILSS